MQTTTAYIQEATPENFISAFDFRTKVVPSLTSSEVIAPSSAPKTEERASIGIGSVLARSIPNDEFNAATFGRISFRSVAIEEEAPLVADSKLQERLEALCAVLRSKY